MLDFRPIRFVLLFLLVACCGMTAQDNPPADQPTFRSNVSEVRVTFFATRGNSEPVENVGKSDFAVVDNGLVIRNFRSFARSDETALDLIALLDVSESVAPRFRAAMSEVLQLVSQEQSVADDNIAVLSFGGLHPAVLCSSGCRSTGAANKLLNVKSGGLTPLHDGLFFAADFVTHRPRPGVRPVVILFSDGRDTISMHSAQEAVDAVVASGALIYAVDIGTSQQSKGTAFLRWVSDATGGLYFSVRDGVSTVLESVLADLRDSYTVTYEVPRRQLGFHSLQLMPTHNLSLRFHSRSGYYYDGIR